MVGTLVRVAVGAMLGGAAVLAAARVLLLRVTVDGASMTPSLRHGDRVLAVRTPVARVRRRAVVVGRPPVPDGPRAVRDPATGAMREPVAVDLFVKRVVGLPGDRVRPRRLPGAPVEVPPGHYYVEGDGEDGVDSAVWGPVPAAHVLGVVVTARRRRP